MIHNMLIEVLILIRQSLKQKYLHISTAVITRERWKLLFFCTLQNCLAAKQVALLVSELNNCLCLNLSFVLCQYLVGGVWSITTWHISAYTTTNNWKTMKI